MSRDRFDPSNISGAATLAKLPILWKEIIKRKLDGDLFDDAWLDQRIEEICQKGKL